MLRHISIKNFKAFGSEQHCRLAPITLIYGPNSAGKSSISQALTLLAQSSKGNLARDGLLSRSGKLDLGGFEAYVHNHETHRQVEFEVQLDCPIHWPIAAPNVPVLSEPYANETFLGTIRTVFSGSANNTPVQSAPLRRIIYTRTDKTRDKAGLTMAFERQQTPVGWTGNGIFRATAESTSSLRAILSARAERLSRAAATFGRELPDAPLREGFAWLTTYGDPTGFPDFIWFDAQASDQLVRRDADLLMHTSADDASSFFWFELTEAAAHTLGRLCVLGPLRRHPQRVEAITEENNESVGTRGDATLNILLHNPREVRRAVNAWLKKFDCQYSVDIEVFGSSNSGRFAALTLQDNSGLRLSLADVGFGLSQVLPILVEGLANEGRVICVEQPELHLHPRLQAHLADFFIETCLSDSEHQDTLASARSQDSEKAGAAPQRSEEEQREINRIVQSIFETPAVEWDNPNEDTEQVSAPSHHSSPANQWIVETHSESLILRIQRRIREGALSPRDVCVLYVSPGSAGSTVKELRIDSEGGFIDEWPDGFFEDGFEDVFGWRN